MAWEPLGFRPAWFAEIDPFCSALLAHHYPGIENLGEFTRIEAGAGPVDVLAGGTPCQSFSVAGRRGGLEDARGNLAIQFCHLAGRLRPRWIVWENVPGVLSSNGGRDFAAILGALAELGYGCAWRVLDAQFFGVPQRRRRVFVVGHLGDWRRAAAVLLEREGMCRDTPSRRKARQVVAGLTANGVGTCGADDNQAQSGHLIAFGGGNTSGALDVSTALTHHGTRQDFDTETFCVNVAPPLSAGAMRFDPDTSESLVAHTLRGEGMDASEDGTGRGTPLIPVAFSAKDYGADAGGIAPTLRAMPHDRSHANAGGQVAVCVQEGQTGVREYDTAGTVRSDAPGSQPGGSLIRDRFAVRRLTPRECERLQGFLDDYTLFPYRGKPAADGPRYRAIGNSMAVPVMRWIGERIRAVHAL